MPIYEYHCKKCDDVVEIMHSMSDESKRLCDTCQGELERLISRSSFSLKGGGWYKDLYSSVKPGADKKSSDSSSSSSSGSSSSGSSSSGSSSSGGSSSGGTSSGGTSSSD